MLRPAGHWPHGAHLRRALRACMRASMPEVRVHPLEIEWAFDKTRENLVVGQIGRVLPQAFQITVGNFGLDFVPVLRAFLEIVRLPPDDFYRVHSCGRTRWVRDR